MNKKYNKSIFIFRRDLRIYDNTGFILALKESNLVIPIFIFDPIQVEQQNEYKSDNCIQFMLESIKDLEAQLKKQDGKLFLLYGNTQEVIKNLINIESIDALFLNRDYTPFSIKRDEQIKHLCIKHNISFNESSDLLLTEPEQIKTGNSEPYSIFTPFYNKASKQIVNEPVKNNYTNFYNKPIKSEVKLAHMYKKVLPSTNINVWVNGGRTNGNKVLDSLKNLENYIKDKDYPYKLTSNLSAHIKFGTFSIREIYHEIGQTLGKKHPLIKQLYWRDFFTHIAYHSSFIFGHAFKPKYENVKWNYNKSLFDKWKNGLTGFPIVDAGMRQLNKTGFMHNRVRMIVGSFLVKDMHMDWREGEKYFAQKLVDYDPSVNNGNWQWVASTGADSQPYFRIFNPWLQQKKFDPDCIYIKEWIPELKDVNSKIIHSLHNLKYNLPNYPKPILNHSIESKITIKMFKEIY